MEDIKINTTFIKIQYFISWTLFILFGFIIAWLIALGLYTYGKNTSINKIKRKGLLNMTYQKFIFIYGLVLEGLGIIALIFEFIF